MLLSTIREAVIDRFTTETIETERLNRFIASAVREYSRFNPRILGATMTTIADQATYDLPDACLWVIECYWWPIGELFAELRAGAEQAYVITKPSRLHMPSERIIDDINQEAHISRLLGHWEQRNDTIVVFPEPTAAADEDLEIVYAAEHVINVGGTGYDTIPDEDLDIIADVTLASYLQARSTEVVLEADYAEGLQRVTKRFIPGNIRATINELRSAMLGKYGGPGVAIAK